jgi:hypothetical protein
MNNKIIIAETVIKLGKTDTELNNVKNDLTNAKIDLARKIEGIVKFTLITRKEIQPCGYTRDKE